jgi:hypothetical protein
LFIVYNPNILVANCLFYGFLLKKDQKEIVRMAVEENAVYDTKTEERLYEFNNLKINEKRPLIMKGLCNKYYVLENVCYLSQAMKSLSRSSFLLAS